MILHVFANRSNVGDWLSAQGIQSLLPPGVPVEELLCDAPFVPATIERIARAGPEDLVVIGGGGLFMDYFRPFWLGFEPFSRRLPFVVWGAGYVDLKAEPSRLAPDLLRPVLARARAVAVRDALSRDLLGLPGVLVAPCPSALAVPPASSAGWGVLHVANYTTAGAAAYEAMRAAAEAFARGTGRPFRETSHRIEAGDRRALAATLELYARSDVVLSSRLHGCIVALAMDRALVAVSGDRKIESLLEPLGLAGSILDAGDLSRLAEAIAGAASAPPAAPSFRADVLQRNRAVAREALAGYLAAAR